MGLFDGVITIVSQGASAIGSGASQLGSAVGSAVNTVIGSPGSSGASVTAQVLASQPTTTTGQAYVVNNTPVQIAPESRPIATPATDPLAGIGGAIQGVISPISTPIMQGIERVIPQIAAAPSAIIQQAPVLLPVMAASPLTAPVALATGIGAGAIAAQAMLTQREASPVYSERTGGIDYAHKMISQTVEMPKEMTLYVSSGRQAQTEVTGINTVLYDRTGGSFVATQVPFGHTIGNIVTGGSTGSLQSGRFSLTPLTPVVYTQESGGTKFAPGVNEAAARDVLANPSKYSNVGAEAYGGVVKELDNRVLGPDTQMGRYPAETGNLANLVNPYGVNLPKSEFAEMPWNVPVSSQATIAAVSKEGVITPASTAELMTVGFKPTTIYTDIGKVGPVERTGSGGGGAGAPPSQPDFVKDVISGIPFAAAATPVVGPAVAFGIGAGKYLTSELTGGAPVAGTAATEVPKPSDYTYRSDTAAVVLEGALFFGDTLTFGLASPGKELLASKGQNINPALETFRSDLSTVEARRADYQQLGSSIEQQRANIDRLTSGKINAEGKFVGSPEEYATYQTALSKLNVDVESYNQFGKDYQQVIGKGYATGAIIPSGEGYIVNPDLENPYGAFSAWQKGVGAGIQQALGQKPVTESQFIAFEQTQQFKESGPIMQFGEGAYKVIATNPAALPAAALQGVEIYAGFGLVNLGIGTLAAPAAEGTAGAGVVSRGALVAQNILNSAAFQYGLGGALIAGTVVEASDFGRNPMEKTISNLGGSAVILTAMGVGGYAPEIAPVVGRGVVSAARFLDVQMGMPMSNEAAVLGPGVGRRPATEAEIAAQISPVRRPATEAEIMAQIAPVKRAATEAEIMAQIAPSRAPATEAELRLSLGLKTEPITPTAPVEITAPVSSKASAILPDDITKALVPLKPERTVIETVYDITRTEGVYRPEEGVFSIRTTRDIIAPTDIGGISSLQRTQALDISTGQYATATGTVLPESPSSIGLIQATRFQTIREVYPGSGRTYEFTTAQKGTIEVPASGTIGTIPSRGIGYGEANVARRAMAEAESVLQVATPRGEKIGATLFPGRSFPEYAEANVMIGKGYPKSVLSPEDLPIAVTDVASTFGVVKSKGLWPGTESVESATSMTRVVRGKESAEDIARRLAEADYGTQGGEGVTPREIQLYPTPEGKPGPAYELYQTLPELGVRVSEATIKQEGLPEVTLAQEPKELLGGVSVEIADIVYGKGAQRFGAGASKFAEKAGTERVVSKGVFADTGRPLPSGDVGFVAGAKLTGPAAGPAAPGKGGAVAEAATLDFSNLDFAKTESSRIGGVVEGLVEKSRAASVTAPQARVEIEYGRRSTAVPVEEEITYYRGTVPGMTRPSAPESDIRSISEIATAPRLGMTPAVGFRVETLPSSATISASLTGELSASAMGNVPAVESIRDIAGATDYARRFDLVPDVVRGIRMDTARAEDYARVFDVARAQDYARVLDTRQVTGQEIIPRFEQEVLPRQVPPGQEVPPPPIVPVLFPTGFGGGGGADIRGLKLRRWMEYFPVGLDISQFGLSRRNPFVVGVERGKYRVKQSEAFGIEPGRDVTPRLPRVRKMR